MEKAVRGQFSWLRHDATGPELPLKPFIGGVDSQGMFRGEVSQRVCHVSRPDLARSAPERGLGPENQVGHTDCNSDGTPLCLSPHPTYKGDKQRPWQQGGGTSRAIMVTASTQRCC